MPLTFTVNQILGYGFTFAIAIAGATWAISLSTISETTRSLEACNKANQLGYPSLVEKINNASVSLEKHLSTLSTINQIQVVNNQLKANNNELTDQIKNLTSDLDKAKEEKNTELKKLSSSHQAELKIIKDSLLKAEQELTSFVSDNILISLERGEGTTVAAATVVVGFHEAKNDGTCDISVNNTVGNKKPGEFIAVKSRGRDCKVILESCKYGYDPFPPAKFRFVCTTQ